MQMARRSHHGMKGTDQSRRPSAYPLFLRWGPSATAPPGRQRGLQEHVASQHPVPAPVQLRHQRVYRDPDLREMCIRWLQLGISTLCPHPPPATTASRNSQSFGEEYTALAKSLSTLPASPISPLSGVRRKTPMLKPLAFLDQQDGKLCAAWPGGRR